MEKKLEKSISIKFFNRILKRESSWKAEPYKKLKNTFWIGLKVEFN